MLLDVPGARLHYEVRGDGPVVLVMGTPMDSASFAGLADELTGRTVVTYDPRGISRSTVDDRHADVPPEMLADDLALLLAAVTDEPADVFGSSGGAVAGLALAQRHPERVRTLVAHEPPIAAYDGQGQEHLTAILGSYREGGVPSAMRTFFRISGLGDEDDATPPPAENPEQELANAEFWLDNLLAPTCLWTPDIDAIRSRVVVGVGAASTGLYAYRTAAALADRLGVAPVEFPGDHVGFLFEPAAFAKVLALQL